MQTISSPARMMSAARLDWLVMIPVLGIAATILAQPAFPLDDAYITLNNARTLLQGGGDPAYAHGSALSGATSPVHLALVAGLGLLLPLPLASALVAIAAMALYGAGLVRLLGGIGCPPGPRALLAVCGLCLGYQPYHLANGLETGLALAALTWALVLADNRWLPLLCGTLPFIRPELAFLAFPLLARHLWRLTSFRQRAAASALALLAALPWLIFSHAETGAILPNTMAAKTFFFAKASLPLAVKAAQAGKLLALSLIGPFFLGLVGLPGRGIGWCALIFVTCWLTLAMLTFPSGLAHNLFRYCALLVPVLLLGWGLLRVDRSSPRGFGLAVLACWSLASGTLGLRQLLDRHYLVARDSMVRDVANTTPPGALILVHDAGYLSWKLPDRRLVDLVGLKTPNGIGWRQALASTPAERDNAIVRTAARYRPDYFVALADDPFWGGLGEPLRKAGWTLVAVASNPGGYTIYRIIPPRGYDTLVP